ncbi:MAG: GNAT family N-acetyltransferase [Sedimentisphaerales bacterium]|nr:GNAT family N-acetyltransferase [Sedimentisphaerales bacterium]
METQTTAETMIAEAEIPAPPAQPSATKRPQGKSRRMKLMERRGCFGELPPEVTISRATSLEDLCEAYQLVHDNYIQKGYISPHPSGLRIRSYETASETATFIAKANGRIIGVTSGVIDSDDLGVPADKAFKTEIDDLRLQGYKVCEGTNWVIAPEYRSTNVMPELMRVCFAYSIAQGCNGMLATVSPNHGHFYEMLCFDQVGSERSSSPDIDDPVVLQLNSYDEFYRRWRAVQPDEVSDDEVVTSFFIADNPYYKRVQEWSRIAEAEFMKPAFLHELFVKQSNFLNECSDKEYTIIRRRWGERFMWHVWGDGVRRKLALTA